MNQSKSVLTYIAGIFIFILGIFLLFLSDNQSKYGRQREAGANLILFSGLGVMSLAAAFRLHERLGR